MLRHRIAVRRQHHDNQLPPSPRSRRRRLTLFLESRRGVSYGMLLLFMFLVVEGSRTNLFWSPFKLSKVLVDLTNTWKQVTQYVSFTWENLITEGPPHPYKGAKDEWGRLGYIHDVEYVKQHAWPLDVTAACALHETTSTPQELQALRKLKTDTFTIPTTTADTSEDDDSNNINNNGSPNTTLATPSFRVLCIVYTHSNRHDEVLGAIVETYAPRCDGFLAASNQTNRTLGAVHILHAGPESYQNMWQKVRSIWTYVYTHYRNDFDCFHMGGDNMWVIPENLKRACYEIQSSQRRHRRRRRQSDHSNQTKHHNHHRRPPPPPKPIYMGGAVVHMPYPNKIYCGGGSGYTLNRAALDYLVKDRLPNCWPYAIDHKEDVLVGHCLAPQLKCQHNADEFDESRYHPLTPAYHANWNHRQRGMWSPSILKDVHKISAAAKEGLASIAATSVSFHLVRHIHKRHNATFVLNDADYMRRIHAIAYGLCDPKM